MKNPVQDLLDQAQSPEEVDRIATAFTRGGAMGGLNVRQHYVSVAKSEDLIRDMRIDIVALELKLDNEGKV